MQVKTFFTIILILIGFSSSQEKKQNDEENNNDSQLKKLKTVKARKTGIDTKNLTKPRESLTDKKILNSSFSNLQQIIKQNFLGLDTFQNKLQYNGLSSKAIRILYNDIPMIGEDNQSISLVLFDPLFLDSVDLIKGSVSAIYGNSGPGGVIDLRPLNPMYPNQMKLKTDISYSFENIFKIKAVFSQKVKNTTYKVGTSYELDDGSISKIDGYDIVDIPKYQQINNVLNLSHDITHEDNIQINLINSYRYIESTPLKYPDLVESFNKNNIFFSIKYDKQFNHVNNNLQTFIAYQNNTLSNDIFTKRGKKVSNEYVEGNNGYQIFQNTIININDRHYFLPWLSLYISAETIIHNTINTNINLVNTTTLEPGKLNKTKFEIGSSTQLSFNIKNRYILALTMRNTYNNQFGYNISPDVSFKYNYNGLVILTLNYGRSFITPSFKDNYYKQLHPTPNSFLITGNENLEPEISDNLNSTITYSPFQWLNFEVVGFFYNFYNKISQSDIIDMSKSGMIEGKSYFGEVLTINKEKFIRAGTNIKIKGNIKNNLLSYYVGYSYLYAKEKIDKDSQLEQSPNIATHKIPIGIALSFPVIKTILSMDNFWTSSRIVRLNNHISSIIQYRTAKPYWNLGLSITQPIYQHFFIYMKIENMLDHKDPDFTQQEGIKYLVGFRFGTDNLLKTHADIRTRQLKF